MNRQCTYAVLVLAAGESKRFGGVKQLHPIGGTPMLVHVINNLCSSKYSLYVVLGAHFEQIMPALPATGVTYCNNKDWASGMASSIHIGLNAIRTAQDVDGVVIVLGDQWRLQAHHIHLLLTHVERGVSTMVATSYHGSPGVPAYFPQESWEVLFSLDGDEGARRVLNQQEGIIMVELPEAHTDLDLPEDAPINW